MKVFAKLRYRASFEATSLLLQASDCKDFVHYKSEDGRVLKYEDFLPPNYGFLPICKFIKQTYKLTEFIELSKVVDEKTGLHSDEYFLALWTLAYYTGNTLFTSDDVVLISDGVNVKIPPLCVYDNAFCMPCDYESIKPPKRAFQVNWHFFSDNRGSLHEQPFYITRAIEHFTQSQYYR